MLVVSPLQVPQDRADTRQRPHCLWWLPGPPSPRVTRRGKEGR